MPLGYVVTANGSGGKHMMKISLGLKECATIVNTIVIGGKYCGGYMERKQGIVVYAERVGKWLWSSQTSTGVIVTRLYRIIRHNEG